MASNSGNDEAFLRSLKESLIRDEEVISRKKNEIKRKMISCDNNELGQLCRDLLDLLTIHEKNQQKCKLSVFMY